MSRWLPHPLVEEDQAIEVEVEETVEAALRRERDRTLQECIDLVFEKLGNDWTANELIAELRRRKVGASSLLDSHVPAGFHAAFPPVVLA